MAITTLMATFVALHWKHNPFVVYSVNGSLLSLDLLFFASTSTKLFEGGWFPLLIALVIAFLMLTWRKGEEIMDKVRLEVRKPSKEFVEQLNRRSSVSNPGHRSRSWSHGKRRAARAVTQHQVSIACCTKSVCSSP